jgi:hypothetical protein
MKSKFATCRHVKTNGRVCQSPALTGSHLCFFHNRLHQTHRRPADAQPLCSNWQEDEVLETWDPTGEDSLALKDIYPNQNHIQFPPLEDAESVQLATSMLFQALATGQIAFKRARLMIATLKIASSNQRALATSRAADTDPVPSHVIRTATGQILAAPDQSEPTEPVPDSVVATDKTETPAASPEPSSKQPEAQTPTKQPEAKAPTVSLKLSSLPLEIHLPAKPPANSNNESILDITHLDTGFCRKRLHANA